MHGVHTGRVGGGVGRGPGHHDAVSEGVEVEDVGARLSCAAREANVRIHVAQAGVHKVAPVTACRCVDHERGARRGALAGVRAEHAADGHACHGDQGCKLGSDIQSYV